MNYKRILVQAPGKVILHGEHAVVYGRKAIACAINGFIQVEVKASSSDEVTFEMSDLLELATLSFSTSKLRAFCKDCNKCQTDTGLRKEKIRTFTEENLPHQNDKLVLVALTVCLFCYCKVFVTDAELDFPCIVVTATSNNLPIGAGLGSSSAFGVALSTAFLMFAGIVKTSKDYNLDSESLTIINDLAFSLEQIVHGTPSGIDNSVSTYGGAVVYEQGKIRHLSNLPELRFLIVDSSVSRNTKLMVSNVKAKYAKNEQVVDSIMSSIHEISNKAENLLQNGTDKKILSESLQELINMNHHLLQAIGVGHPKLSEIHKIASAHGFACKLTGAGGGGCAIVLLHSDENFAKLKKELDANHFKNWEVKLGCPGVKVCQVETVT